MSDEPPTVDEARTMAYEMAFKRFEPMENVAGDQWHELSTRQQRRVIADQLSAWKQGVVFRTVVAPALRSIANQLAESQENGENTTQTIVINSKQRSSRRSTLAHTTLIWAVTATPV